MIHSAFWEATLGRATLRLDGLSDARRTEAILGDDREACAIPLVLHALEHQGLQPVHDDPQVAPDD